MQESKGFTLLELLITISIVGILATFAVPALSNYVDKGRLTGASEDVRSFLQYSRSEAIARNADIFVSIKNAGSSNWCIGITTDSGYCDCTDNLPACKLSTLDGALNDAAKSLNGRDFKVVVLAATATQWSIDVPRAVTSSPIDLTLTHPNIGDVMVSLNKLGRARICSDAISNYPDC